MADSQVVVDKTLSYVLEESAEASSNSDGSSEKLIVEGVRFAQSNILNPTYIGIRMVNQSTAKSIRLSELKIECDQLLLTADFKDIDFIYTLYRRYELAIYPALMMMRPKSNEDLKAKESQNQPEQQPSSPLPDERIEINGDDRSFSDSDSETSGSEEENFYGKEIPAASSELKFKSDIQRQSIEISAIILSLSDGEMENYIGLNPSMPNPLIELIFNNVAYNMKTYDIKGQSDKALLALPIDLYIKMMKDKMQPEMLYYELSTSCAIYATYYNETSQAFEPFIEPWAVGVRIEQKTKHDIQDIRVESNDFLNINFTHGMAQQIKEIKARIVERTFKIDEELKELQELKEKVKESQIVQESKVAKSLESQLQGRGPQPHYDISKTYKALFNQNNPEKNTGYKFYNYTGTNVKLCLSNIELDGDLNEIASSLQLQRQDNLKKRVSIATVERITEIKGCTKNDPSELLPVTKDSNHFQLQKLNNKHIKRMKRDDQIMFNDYIEDEPLTIDLKISGIRKVANLPIEIVGVYSYQAVVENTESSQEIEAAKKTRRLCYRQPKEKAVDKVNMIMKVNTEGKQRIISFESQLLIMNNLNHSLKLSFRIRKINKHAALLSWASSRRTGTFNIFAKIANGGCRERDRRAGTEYCKAGRPKDDMLVQRQSKDRLDLRVRRTTWLDKLSPRSRSESRSVVEEQSDEAAAGHQSVDLSAESDKRPERLEAELQHLLEQPHEIELKPHNVFRVPLMWLMHDSEVDVYLKLGETAQGASPYRRSRKEKEHLLFKNIQHIFNKTAADKEVPSYFKKGIESKVVEIDNNFYVSVDVQGYACGPKQTQSKNPLQYVVSLNPPLMLANYSMSPLELREFETLASSSDAQARTPRRRSSPDLSRSADSRGTEEPLDGQKQVFSQRIAPSTTGSIRELDLSSKNQSMFLLQFIDTEMTE